MTFWLFAGFVILVAALIRLGRLGELHHGYYGFLIGGLAAMGNVSWLELAAIVVLWDDASQHAIQCVYPTFLSPLHWLYGVTLWRLRWVQLLNARLDAWLDDD
jgi:hypothetical protein